MLFDHVPFDGEEEHLKKRQKRGDILWKNTLRFGRSNVTPS